MNNSQQLRRGVLATVLVVAACLLLSLAVSPEFLMGWGTLALVAMVPTQIVISLVWQSAYPRVLADLPQPWRGLAFLVLNVAVGAVVGFIAWKTLGGGIVPPTPFVNMFLIFAVPVALFLVIPLQTWPLNLVFKTPGALGVALVVSTYALTWLLFRQLFNFGFMSGAPFYSAGLDPHGAFMAWLPLVASIAAVVPILGLVLLDFWPVSLLARRFPFVGKQPVFGLVAGAVIVGIVALMWTLFVSNGGMDIVLFMVRICVTFNFGCFILLVMFEGVPSLKLPQPWRGIVLNLLAGVLAVLMLWLYETLAARSFALPSGGPGYPMELWLASSMLAVTFPAMVVFSSFFQFWPLSSAGNGESITADTVSAGES
jgi:hypothetical protein